MWDDRDDKMGWKDGDGMEKSLQGTTTNVRTYHCSDKLGVGVTKELHGDL